MKAYEKHDLKLHLFVALAVSAGELRGSLHCPRTTTGSIKYGGFVFNSSFVYGFFIVIFSVTTTTTTTTTNTITTTITPSTRTITTTNTNLMFTFFVQ